MTRIDHDITCRARELRNNATTAERAVWFHLSRYAPRFTRQLPIGPFIVDFACRSMKLVVELDGASHDSSIAYDEQRSAFLRARGWRVLRFGNQEALENPAGVASACASAASDKDPPLTPP